MSDNRTGEEVARDQIIQAACRAAANVMARKGLSAHDIANGMISFGGAAAMELVGVEMTADVFQSKADALRGQVSN